MRGVNRLDGDGPDFGVTAQSGIIGSGFAFQEMGQFPGHVFGLVLDDIFAHDGQNAVRMKYIRIGDVADGLVGDFDGAPGEVAQDAGRR